MLSSVMGMLTFTVYSLCPQAEQGIFPEYFRIFHEQHNAQAKTIQYSKVCDLSAQMLCRAISEQRLRFLDFMRKNVNNFNEQSDANYM